MKNKLNNCRGFTIVELLVTVSLTAMLIVTVGSFFLNHLRSYHQAVEDISVQDQAKAAMNLFIEQAMETKGLSTLSAPEDNPYIVKLERVKSEDDPEDFLIFSYYHSEGDISENQLKWGIGIDANDAENIVVGKITDFQVSYDGANPKMARVAKVTIEVTGSDTGIPVTLENSLRFRNYSP